MTKQDRFTQIAKQHLFIETLEVRNSDRLDFHDVGVVGVRKALEAAFTAGREDMLAVLTASEALLTAKGNQMETVVEWRNLRRAVRRARRDETTRTRSQH